MEINEILRSLLSFKNISQSELARKLPSNIEQKHISEILSGNRKPTSKTLELIASALNSEWILKAKNDLTISYDQIKDEIEKVFKKGKEGLLLNISITDELIHLKIKVKKTDSIEIIETNSIQRISVDLANSTIKLSFNINELSTRLDDFNSLKGFKNLFLKLNN